MRTASEVAKTFWEILTGRAAKREIIATIEAFQKGVERDTTQRHRDSIAHLYLEDESPEHDDTGRKVVLMILADLDASLKEEK